MLFYEQWTKEQDALLHRLYKETPKEELEKILKKSWHTIRVRASKFYLKRSPLVVSLEKRRNDPIHGKYVDKEIEILKEFYSTKDRKFIMGIYKQKGINRTWACIQALAKNLELEPYTKEVSK
jgi:hypothetical protein